MSDGKSEALREMARREPPSSIETAKLALLSAYEHLGDFAFYGNRQSLEIAESSARRAADLIAFAAGKHGS